MVILMIYLYKTLNFESPNPMITEIVNKLRTLFLGIAIIMLPGILGFGVMMLTDIGATAGMINLYSRFYQIASIAAYIIFAVSVVYTIISIMWVFIKKDKEESIKRYGRA
jgi:hypothetical protein